MSAASGVAQPAVTGSRTAVPAVASVTPCATSEALLVDPGYVRLVRWVFTARLVCLALATPAALTIATSTPVATLSLFLLTISSLVFSRSDRLNSGASRGFGSQASTWPDLPTTLPRSSV